MATEDTENGDGNFLFQLRATKNTFFPRRATENGNGTLFFPFRGPKIGAHHIEPEGGAMVAALVSSSRSRADRGPQGHSYLNSATLPECTRSNGSGLGTAISGW